jgi:hypothetical protein
MATMTTSEARPRAGSFSSTANLRRQHAALLQLSSEISASLRSEEGVVRDAHRLRTQLSALAGILNVHLAMEDGVMYPRLRVDQDPSIRLIARRFVEEMGDLRRSFAEYAHRWNTPEAIRAAPREFARESRLILEALTLRIAREEHELYPLVDGAPATVVVQRSLAAASGTARPR